MTDLLRKYYDGETSLEEEQILEEHFITHPDQSPEHAWFKGRHTFKHETPSATLETRVVSSLESQKSALFMRPWYIGIAATVVFTLLVFILYSTFIRQSNELITVESGPSQKKIMLEDGSTITLNNHSTIQYPETLDGRTREVWLQDGEAFFEISRDPKRPFIVHTPDTRTEVLATSFNIRTAAHKDTEVVVITGIVSFNSGGSNEKEKVILHAGTAGTFHSQEKRIERFDEIDPNTIAWMTHQLEFNDVPVAEVFKTLETYFNVTIQTSDSNILSCRFRGSFKNAKLAEIFEVMTFSLDLTLSEQGKTYIVSGKGCKQN